MKLVSQRRRRAHALSRLARVLVALVLFQLSGAAALTVSVVTMASGQAHDDCCEDERQGRPCSPDCACALCLFAHPTAALEPSALLLTLPRFASETALVAEPPLLAPREAPLYVFRPPRAIQPAFAS